MPDWFLMFLGFVVVFYFGRVVGMWELARDVRRRRGLEKHCSLCLCHLGGKPHGGR